jgi:hypothetical protein
MFGDPQKIPFQEAMNTWARAKLASFKDSLPKSVPATLVSLDPTHTIATVNIEIDSQFTIPHITMPLFGPEWIRWPLKKGTKGVVLSANYYIGEMSGLGTGRAHMVAQGSLSTGVFFPIGNVDFEDDAYPDSTWVYGPEGVVLSDPERNSVLEVTGTELSYVLDNYENIHVDQDKLVLKFGGVNGDLASIVMSPEGLVLTSLGNTIELTSTGIRLSHGNKVIQLDDAGVNVTSDTQIVNQVGGQAVAISTTQITATSGSNYININPTDIALQVPDASIVLSTGAISTSAATITLTTDSGSSIKMDAAITISGSGGNTIIDGHNFVTHLHSNVTSGGSNTGQVV